ncbi:MAG: hypothetical protein R3C11_13930 [Planctomycetaceae bacterium]
MSIFDDDTRDQFSSSIGRPGSSKTPISGLMLMLGCGLITLIAGAVCQAALTIYVPYVKIRFFSPLISGFVGGTGLMMGAYWGKVRSEKVRMIVGAIMGLFFIYLCWAVYLSWIASVALEQTVVVWNPIHVFSAIKFLYEENPTGIRGLVFWWLAEAIILYLFPQVMSFSKNDPFCESCNCWTKKKLDADLFKLEGLDITPAAAAEEGDGIVEHLELTDQTDGSLLGVEIYSCPECPDTNYFSLSQVTIAPDKDGKLQRSTGVVYLDKLPVSQERVSQIEELIAERERLMDSDHSLRPPKKTGEDFDL